MADWQPVISQPSLLENTPGKEAWNRPRNVALLCLALAAITLAVFLPSVRNLFVNYDDDLYVYENPTVIHGLTAKGMAGAFGIHAVNWHPVTWLSHELDYQIYGLHPWGHHLTSVLLHTATVVLLFLLLRELTGAVWPAAFVAAVFGIHPLRVESVAWVSERKDVLSGLFFVLTIWAYARFVRRKTMVPYVLSLLCFALGLMSKPMLVTVPVILLLLDYWPLRRSEPLPALLMEKLPYAALSGAVCAVTLYAQTTAIHTGGMFSLPARLANALVSSAVYIKQIFLPAPLVVLYPFPTHGTPAGPILLSGILLAGLSIIAWKFRRTQPWLLVGWAWYLAMLLPVSGIIQVGRQAHADRYTYLPQIGIYVALTWLAAQWRMGRALAAALAGGVLIALAVCSWRQIGYWQNSETLWKHALACTVENELAHVNLGAFYAKSGRLPEASAEYETALKINPDSPSALNDLASIFLAEGQADGARRAAEKAIQLQPEFPEPHLNLARALEKLNRPADAVSQYEEFLRMDPTDADGQNNLGMLLRKMGRLDEALAHYQIVEDLMPGDESIHVNLANAYLQKGMEAQAVAQFDRALELAPADMEVQNNLAWLLATSPQASLRDGKRAVDLALKANKAAAGKNPIVLGTLAAAFAEAGNFSEARRAAQQGIAVANAAGQKQAASRLAQQLKRYEANHPLHP